MANSPETPFRVLCDVGVDGAYALGQYQFDSLLDKRTWETPAIRPLDHDTPRGDAWEAAGLRICLKQGKEQGAAAYGAEIANLSNEMKILNGLAFTVCLGESADFIFPLNTPPGVIKGADIAEHQVVQGGLVSPAIHVMLPDQKINLLFHDTVEKWSLGVYRAGGALYAVCIAALECRLAPGESVVCGNLYIQSPTGDPFLAIRDFFAAQGYAPAEGGLQGGVMYSCHPNGTMDGMMDKEPNGPGLKKYAEYLPVLRDMGVDHVWLLPIFEHEGRGVYHTSDQSVVDKRYGGDEAVKYYVDQAHKLGMTVLFDYVPHGPAKQDKLAKDHPAWCSLRIDGTPQEEWDCVSFDMTLPDYQKYTTDLVRDHVDRFGIDGARIDCAMGGLSNWKPMEGHRPSASNLSGGVDITRAIFDGFRAYDKKTLVLPENFNPVPAYYPVTDVFYGMNFYRVLVALDEQYRDDPAAYVREMTNWLEIEHKTMPAGLGRLRFLGNHDTVSWVWQASRAVDFYGLGRAKALFSLIFLIDGLPMIYMGDEDPSLACKQGAQLRDFFKELIALRKATVGDSRDMSYLRTGNGIFACTRENAGKTYLVAVNLSDHEETASPLGQAITLPAYGRLVTAL